MLAPVLKKITPAVVNIETRGQLAQDPKSRRRAPREVNNVGSGVVYDAQRGLIVTNDHVLEHANDITVTLTDGRVLKAKRVGGDPDFDLAVISVPTERLIAIAFGPVEYRNRGVREFHPDRRRDLSRQFGRRARRSAR